MVQQRSLQEARDLLRHWLTVQIAKYNQCHQMSQDLTRPLTETDAYFMYALSLPCIIFLSVSLLRCCFRKARIRERSSSVRDVVRVGNTPRCNHCRGMCLRCCRVRCCVRVWTRTSASSTRSCIGTRKFVSGRIL